MQTATERMNFHQPEKSLPNRPFGRKVQEVDSKLPEQEESKVERKPKRKAKSK